MHRWQVVLGQRASDAAINQSVSFDGWVHCKGPKEVFMQANDVELKETMEKMGADFFDGGIIVWERCVKETFFNDTSTELELGKKW